MDTVSIGDKLMLHKVANVCSQVPSELCTAFAVDVQCCCPKTLCNITTIVEH